MDYKKDIRDTRKRTKTTITPQQLLELGKLPPQAVEIEVAVLGAIMQDKDALTSIIDILRPEMFYKEAHQHIFEAIQTLFKNADPADILTVIQELKRAGKLEIAQGPSYVTSLTDKISSAANVEFHARIVIQKFIHRELIRISTDTLQNSYDDTQDVFDLLAQAEQNIFSISNTTIKKTFEHIKTVLSRTIDEIEAAKNQQFSGVPSGFTSLDKITGGWRKSDLIIIAARPGAGKTSFLTTIARNAAVDFNKPIGIFSLEMSSTQIVSRLISSEAELSADKLRAGEVTETDWQNLHQKIAKLADAPIYIDDTPALSIFEFHAKAKRLKSQYGVEMIIVDYLQLMVAGGDKNYNREQEVAMVSRTLKSIAKQLDIPIIALAQMSRSVEQRGGTKRPQLSDLRESGQIEMDADIVAFIYRPWICGIQEDEQGNSTEGTAEIIIAKHRNGRIDSAHLMFIDHFAKFVEPSSSMNFQSSSPNNNSQFSNDPPPLKVEPNNDFLNEGPSRNIDF